MRTLSGSGIIVLTMAVTACTLAPGGTTPGPTENARTPPTPHAGATPPPPPPAIVAEFDAGGDGWAMTKAGEALWIQVDPPIDAIVRIDVNTGAAVPAIPGGTDAKSGPEGLWVACCDGIARVDPATGKKLLDVRLDGAFALADGAIWTMSKQGLQELDPETGAAGGKPVGSVDPSDCDSWKDMIVAFESAWLACKEGVVVRVDLASGRLTSIETGLGSHTFTVSDASVWVTNYQEGTISRIDPETNRVTQIPDVGSGVGITSGDGFVWAAVLEGIAKIDPATNEVVDLIELGSGEYYELVWDDGIIWASTRSSRVLKVDTQQ